jgi:hypothetical protein
VDYSEVFSDISKYLFQRYADSSEKCRELALKITIFFFEHASDFTQILAYYVPALTQRVSSKMAYDEELQIFVTDLDAHEAYKRGRSVSRQDKGGSSGLLTHTVVELSEEIRLLTCSTMTVLLKRLVELSCVGLLYPYFNDVMFFLQAQLRDPYPELKIEAANNIEILARIGEYELGEWLYVIKYPCVLIFKCMNYVNRYEILCSGSRQSIAS